MLPIPGTNLLAETRHKTDRHDCHGKERKTCDFEMMVDLCRKNGPVLSANSLSSDCRLDVYIVFLFLFFVIVVGSPAAVYTKPYTLVEVN